MNLFGPKIDKPHSVVKNCIIPHELWFDTEQHLWLRDEGDGSWTLGLSDMAQTLGGKVLHYKPWQKGSRRPARKTLVMLEAAKWLGVIRVPFPSEIVAVNEELLNDTYMINQYPYTKGWLVCIRPDVGVDVTSHYIGGEEAGKVYAEHFEEWQLSECVHCLGFEV